MTTYYADTGMHLYEFKADSDLDACLEYPDAIITRTDGKPLEKQDCREAFCMNQ